MVALSRVIEIRLGQLCHYDPIHFYKNILKGTEEYNCSFSQQRANLTDWSIKLTIIYKWLPIISINIIDWLLADIDADKEKAKISQHYRRS